MYQRQISFTEAISMALNKYCCFSGRASRSEFWWFELFTLILSVAVTIPELIFSSYSMIFSGLDWAINLALLLPSLGLTIRRLHDIGKGGGWIFINLIPLVGQIIFLVWMCKNSEPSDNRFGPVPNIVE